MSKYAILGATLGHHGGGGHHGGWGGGPYFPWFPAGYAVPILVDVGPDADIDVEEARIVGERVGDIYYTAAEITDLANSLSAEMLTLQQDILRQGTKLGEPFLLAWKQFVDEVQGFIAGIGGVTFASDMGYHTTGTRLTDYKNRMVDWRKKIEAAGGTVTAPKPTPPKQDGSWWDRLSIPWWGWVIAGAGILFVGSSVIYPFVARAALRRI